MRRACLAGGSHPHLPPSPRTWQMTVVAASKQTPSHAPFSAPWSPSCRCDTFNTTQCTALEHVGAARFRPDHAPGCHPAWSDQLFVAHVSTGTQVLCTTAYHLTSHHPPRRCGSCWGCWRCWESGCGCTRTCGWRGRCGGWRRGCCRCGCNFLVRCGADWMGCLCLCSCCLLYEQWHGQCAPGASQGDPGACVRTRALLHLRVRSTVVRCWERGSEVDAGCISPFHVFHLGMAGPHRQGPMQL